MDTTSDAKKTRQTKRKASMGRPDWWKDEHDSTWERVKAAFKRDWDQTTGEELRQDIGDTVKQAMGKEPIPPRHVPNPPDGSEKWEDVEDAFRFGHGARAHYGEKHAEWNDDLEALLQHDWDASDPRDGWERRSYHIRRGYEQPFI
jgi:hypothetical protein